MVVIDSGAALAAEPRAAELRDTTERMARYILDSCDFSRGDRLCPSDTPVFGTNPLSVAYGASGIALFLHRALGEVPERVREWMMDRPLSLDTYAPGLLVGLSGIAWAFAEVGWEERAGEVMRQAYRSHLLFDDAGIAQGAAGWGWASLSFWDRTGEQEYLDQAVRAGEHLLRIAEADGDTLFWRHAGDGGRIHYGFGYGSAGVALFLLYLGQRTGRADFTDAAVRGLDYDLAQKLDTANGTSWKRYEGDAVNYPYFLHGASGIGSVALRFAHLLGGERYWDVVREVAHTTDVSFTLFPGMVHGLAGIADFAVDLYRFTGDEAHLERAHRQAESILLYRLQTETGGGVAFPGRQLLRICNEWADGSAGIGLFFHRLLNPAPRLLVDLEGSSPVLPGLAGGIVPAAF